MRASAKLRALTSARNFQIQPSKQQDFRRAPVLALLRTATDSYRAGRYLDAALAAEADAYRALLAGEDSRPALAHARDAYLASHAETGPKFAQRLASCFVVAGVLQPAGELTTQFSALRACQRRIIYLSVQLVC